MVIVFQCSIALTSSYYKFYFTILIITEMSKKRIAICRFEHEANTFSPLDAGLEEFQNTVGGILIGEDLLNQPDRSDEIKGFLNVLRSSEEIIEIVPLISASGFAGGNVTAEVGSYLEENLRQMLREAGDLDGFLFALHGAMASKEIPDLELIRD